MKGGFGPVQILDEGDDAPFVVEVVALFVALIENVDLHSAIEKSQFPQPLGEGFEGKLGGFENFRVGPESDVGPPFDGAPSSSRGAIGNSAFVALPVNLASAANFQFQLARKGIDDRNADPVQATGNLIGVAVEFAARMQDGHDHFCRRFFLGGVHLDRDSAAVVLDRHRAVEMDDDRNLVAMAGQSFVDGVVDNFIDQMVQTRTVRWSRYTWPGVCAPLQVLPEP